MPRIALSKRTRYLFSLSASACCIFLTGVISCIMTCTPVTVPRDRIGSAKRLKKMPVPSDLFSSISILSILFPVIAVVTAERIIGPFTGKIKEQMDSTGFPMNSSGLSRVIVRLFREACRTVRVVSRMRMKRDSRSAILLNNPSYTWRLFPACSHRAACLIRWIREPARIWGSAVFWR